MNSGFSSSILAVWRPVRTKASKTGTDQLVPSAPQPMVMVSSLSCALVVRSTPSGIARTIRVAYSV